MAVIGFVLICTHAVAPLFWFIPLHWGLDIEGEWQGTRETMTNVVGFALGILSIFILNHRQRLKENSKRHPTYRRPDVEVAQALSFSQTITSVSAESELKNCSDENDEVHYSKEQILVEMNSEELNELWDARPFISWSEPMSLMSFNEQKKYWLQHLDITFWEIPRHIRESVVSRLVSK